MLLFLRTIATDVIRVIAMMPNVVMAAFGITFIVDALQMLLGGRHLLATVVINLAGWILLAFYFITVHRFVILGEVASRFPISFDRRVRRFVGAGVLLSLLWAVPVLIVALIGFAARYAAAPAAYYGLVVGIGLLVLLAAVALSMRLVVFLPAIAVDAPGAGWANAFRDTKGHAWRIFVTYLVCVLPLGLAAAAIAVVVRFGSLIVTHWMPFAAGLALVKLGTAMVHAAISVIGITVFAAIASRIFEGVADRLVKPAPVAGG